MWKHDYQSTPRLYFLAVNSEAEQPSLHPKKNQTLKKKPNQKNPKISLYTFSLHLKQANLLIFPSPAFWGTL